jgi:hypothetical protein
MKIIIIVSFILFALVCIYRRTRAESEWISELRILSYDVDDTYDVDKLEEMYNEVHLIALKYSKITNCFPNTPITHYNILNKIRVKLDTLNHISKTR